MHDDMIQLGLFASRVDAACEEMGVVLARSALSPNIKDRLDFSCAVFDPAGRLCAQAAHIPVHLGSMAYAMAGIVGERYWRPGDMLVLNDPFLGGTHLPDVTLVAPLFVGGELLGFVANRAHHANIGAESPGSMPVSTRLEDEGVLIPPSWLLRDGDYVADTVALLGRVEHRPTQRLGGDFAAQVSANLCGLRRLEVLVERDGPAAWLDRLARLNDYAEQLARSVLQAIPDGEYRFEDVMDDDGAGTQDIPIRARVAVSGSDVTVDFAGTGPQVRGNINCPLSVAAAAVFYVVRCLMPPQAPACAGLFAPVRLLVPEGSLLNARPPAAVAAGNVETSSRVVDVVLGALAQAIPQRIPAAAHGSMNNVAMGARGPVRWDYYETIGGGMGASAAGPGQDGVQTHLTNTLNTPIESLEMHYPLRVTRYALRRGSGGAGMHRGGDGLVREIEFLAPTEVTLLTERRRHRPWGLGGGPGAAGENRLNGELLPPKCTLVAQPGDRLTVATPGGGGWSPPEPNPD